MVDTIFKNELRDSHARSTNYMWTIFGRKQVNHYSKHLPGFDCKEAGSAELMHVQAVLTNEVLSFCLNSGKYVYHYRSLDSEILVDRGRETITQKVIEYT